MRFNMLFLAPAPRVFRTALDFARCDSHVAVAPIRFLDRDGDVPRQNALFVRRKYIRPFINEIRLASELGIPICDYPLADHLLARNYVVATGDSDCDCASRM